MDGRTHRKMFFNTPTDLCERQRNLVLHRELITQFSKRRCVLRLRAGFLGHHMLFARVHRGVLYLAKCGGRCCVTNTAALVQQYLGDVVHLPLGSSAHRVSQRVAISGTPYGTMGLPTVRRASSRSNTRK